MQCLNGASLNRIKWQLLGGKPVEGEFMLDGPTARPPGIVGNSGGPRCPGCGGGNN